MRRCLFLDRDGVINAAPPAGEYIRSWDEFRLLPEVVAWIRLFKAAGYLAIVVTNQRGIALGRYSEADLLALHEKMRATWQPRALSSTISSIARMRRAPATAASPCPEWCSRRKRNGISISPLLS